MKAQIINIFVLAIFSLISLWSINSDAAHHQQFNANEIPQLSIQLWSVRETMKIDAKGTLKQLKDMGFNAVEFAQEFGEFKNNAKGLKAYMDSIGIKGSSAHVSFDALKQDFSAILAFYQILDIKILVVGWDTRAWDAKGIEDLVKDINIYTKKFAEYGIHFGFHNHDKEFNDYNADTFWDYIAQNTNENTILQQDVGWTNYAGKDPVEYVKRYPGRTLVTHYKIRTLPESTKVSPIIGQETEHKRSIDWVNLIKANTMVGNTKWIIIEQEEYPDGLTPMASVKASKAGLDTIIYEMKNKKINSDLPQNNGI